jgi:hypothetical protein
MTNHDEDIPHEHNADCARVELNGGVWICLDEHRGLRAQIEELEPQAGDLLSVTYVADNPDGTKRFAVEVTRA